MAASEGGLHYVRLASPPKDVTHCPGMIAREGHSRFIMVGVELNSRVKCMCEYSAHSDSWRTFVRLPNADSIHAQNLAINEKTQMLYLLTRKRMEILDLESLQIETTDIGMPPRAVNGMVFAGGRVHVIFDVAWSYYGRFGAWRHAVWSDATHSFDVIHNTLQFNPMGASMIYVPSKRIILLIGGACEGVWRYSLESSEWHKVECIIADQIVKYSPVLALTSNEQHVIISCGIDDDGRFPIWILDIKDDDAYGLRKSKTRPPKLIWFYSIVRSGGLKDEMLVIGWIKAVFGSAALGHMKLPPEDITRMVAKWYSEESIHFFADVGGDHFAIKLKQLLL